MFTLNLKYVVIAILYLISDYHNEEKIIIGESIIPTNLPVKVISNRPF